MKDVGTVKWFDNKKAFGFVVCSEGDVFVHHSVISRKTKGEFVTLAEGEKVNIEYERVPKGLRATSVLRMK